MEIFKWANEIEKVYDDLIEKAKKESLAEIKALRNNQEKMVEFLLNQKQNIVNSALINLAEEVVKEIANFKKVMKQDIKNIEDQFNKRTNDLTKSIIKEIGLDF